MIYIENRFTAWRYLQAMPCTSNSILYCPNTQYLIKQARIFTLFLRNPGETLLTFYIFEIIIIMIIHILRCASEKVQRFYEWIRAYTGKRFKTRILLSNTLVITQFKELGILARYFKHLTNSASSLLNIMKKNDIWLILSHCIIFTYHFNQ